ncbi:TPR repeat-containing protein [Microseira wollei NIES-4236]|uniref:TPR repeat-containing protein n=2 Tax=Microseira wollei TaxID=467598 RepID=A0AAV3XQF6_9CYAN|nr:TPR repeat-containing protein [Microseira wollei NIES-4236]
MKNAFLSRFTPSLMAPETLEAIFVQRHKLADDLVAAIRESAVTEKKHCNLLVGMRGMGKTHLIALIYHRIAKMDDLRDKLLIAWLREEEWGVSSFLDLLLRIFRALETEYPQEYKAKLYQQVEALYLSPDEAEEKAAELLREFVGKRTLLLLMENLDDLFNGLGKSGQKKLRDYIENYSFLTILATAQCLFDAVGVKNYPFYGFFEIHELKELNLDKAIDLLAHIAALEDDRELEDFIRTPTGRDRIKAIHYLAGGNPRVYVIFSQFLTRKSLDELVEPFMKMLDDLTPYYQARMSWLSQQQRKVIEFLSDRRHAVTVKEIAQRCFITHQTASSQLKDLRDKGYVNSESIGRESFYELREPLMRFCFEVKKQRGEPIRLFVYFLRVWYSRTELQQLVGLGMAELDVTREENYSKYQQRLKPIPPDAVLEREYIFYALQAIEKDDEDPRVRAYSEEYKNCIEQEDYINALQLAEKLVVRRGQVEDWLKQGGCLYELKRYEEALESCNRAIALEPNYTYAWNNRGNVLLNLNRKEEALASYDQAIALDPNIADVWLNRGDVLSHLNRKEEALESYNKAIALDPNDAYAWCWRGYVLDNLNRFEEALESCDKAVALDPDYKSAWYNRGDVLNNLNRFEEALESYGKTIALDPDYKWAWVKQGLMLVGLERYEEALESCDKAIALDPYFARVWVNRGFVMENLNRKEEALESYDKAIALDPNYALAWCNRGDVLYDLNRKEEALESYDQAINLGKQSSYVFFNRAISLLGLNRWDEGITTLDNAFNRLADGEKPYAESSELIIRNLFNSTHDAAMWKNRIASLIEIYNKYQAVSVLGQGLVKRESISALMSEMVSDKAAQTWLEVWRELVGDVSEFLIPLRLLNAAVRYKETKGDRRVLLELPIEERNLLQELLETSGD